MAEYKKVEGFVLRCECAATAQGVSAQRTEFSLELKMRFVKADR
jgi:hypothetical protein